MPAVRSWHQRYKGKGLVVILNHAPEFAFEKNVSNVRAALARHKITFPVVMDNDHTNWRAFGNRYWPTKYLIGKKGIIRFKRIGEGHYEATEAMIQKLLVE